MDIKELNDLELVKNALENYVRNIEKSTSLIKSLNAPEIITDMIDKQVIRGKELLDIIDGEFKEKIAQNINEKISGEDKSFMEHDFVKEEE